jgi:hypothetical protein
VPIMLRFRKWNFNVLILRNIFLWTFANFSFHKISFLWKWLVQATFIMPAFVMRAFAYPRFYFSIMKSPSFLPVLTVEATTHAYWVTRASSIALTAILTVISLPTSYPLLSLFLSGVPRLTRFRYMRRFSGVRLSRITSSRDIHRYLGKNIISQQ